MTDYVTDDNWLTYGTKNVEHGVVMKDIIEPDYNEGVICGISIMMSMDKKFWERRVYSIGDLMNEIGGFSQFLVLYATLMLPLFQSDSLEKYLIK